MSKITRKILDTLSEDWLEPEYDRAQSFYKKARVEEDGNKLYSYDTLVAEIKDGKPIIYNAQSQTTRRHIRDFLLQKGFNYEEAYKAIDDFKKSNGGYKPKVEESLKEDYPFTHDVTIYYGTNEDGSDDIGEIEIFVDNRKDFPELTDEEIDDAFKNDNLSIWFNDISSEYEMFDIKIKDGYWLMYKGCEDSGTKPHFVIEKDLNEAAKPDKNKKPTKRLVMNQGNVYIFEQTKGSKKSYIVGEDIDKDANTIEKVNKYNNQDEAFTDFFARVGIDPNNELKESVKKATGSGVSKEQAKRNKDLANIIKKINALENTELAGGRYNFNLNIKDANNEVLKNVYYSLDDDYIIPYEKEYAPWITKKTYNKLCDINQKISYYLGWDSETDTTLEPLDKSYKVFKQVKNGNEIESIQVDDVESEEQAAERVSEIEAETGCGAYYKEVKRDTENINEAEEVEYIYSNAQSYDESDAESFADVYSKEFPKLRFRVSKNNLGMYFVDFIGKYQDICDALIQLGWYDEREINEMTNNHLIKPINESAYEDCIEDDDFSSTQIYTIEDLDKMVSGTPVAVKLFGIGEPITKTSLFAGKDGDKYYFYDGEMFAFSKKYIEESGQVELNNGVDIPEVLRLKNELDNKE